MRNRISNMLTLSGLALSVCSATTLAQVAPPPTKTPAEEPAKAAPAQPTASPQPKQAKPQSSGTRVGKIPTNIAYPKLAVKNADGKIIRLKELPDILALRSNPTVGSGSVEAIMPIIYSRRARFEIMTINNLDLYWGITNGSIDNMSMGDMKGMAKIADMVKPLIGKTTLSQELTNRGILSRVQGGMNTHIVSEYKKAVGDEIQFLEGDDSLDKFMQFILYDSFQESRLAYQALLAELILNVNEAVANSGINSSAAKSLVQNELLLDGAPAQIEAEINQFDKVFRTLTVDEGIALLGSVRALRENQNVSPLVNQINVMHEYKSVSVGTEVIIHTPEELAEMERKQAEQRRAEKARIKALAEEVAAKKAAKEAAEKTEEANENIDD